MSFEQSMNKLEEILRKLEDNSISLEDSITEYQEGIKLVEACRKQLDEAKQKITIAEVPDEV